MKTREQRIVIPAADVEIQAVVIEPVGRPARTGVLYFTDIFQLTESTLRTARRLAAEGFLVCLPEIYPRDFPGAALAFDDAGKADGLAGAAATTTAQFDADRAVVLDHLAARDDLDEVVAVGFCLGGHLAFRAAFDPRVAATVCFYPTGLHDGKLGADVADSLARAGEVQGRLMVIFGSADPHVPAPARLQTITALYEAGHTELELHVFSGGEHAFMRDVGPRHDPELTDRALVEAVSFLRGRS
ncbi:carboxymethylenebutenolidase [Microlunatus sagamiharensis]|uniref:Carboxymethylenebutenolidase n=1 Tax=Microlunatus sagamiharensis TaxID=546874 RepID=A0A1H2MXL9_9ACTN|nr:dienelactone hydrolase family protein [Microlunatus sagamiharensis]SDU98063.1 carboxymethylenebutenolidase [Microlunatus sagamiharensis]